MKRIFVWFYHNCKLMNCHWSILHILAGGNAPQL
jgi:hypothetical protein